MNKQRFLAELQRLLVFMTDADRAETVRRYTELFDSVGPEGEADLIAEIGTPTKAAIGLSRGYEPGKLPDELPGVPAERSARARRQDTPWDEMPTFDLPDYIEEMMPDEPADTRPDEPERPFVLPELPRYAAPEENYDSEPVVERSMPLGLGVPLFVLVIVGLGLPIAGLFLSVSLALLTPGCAVVYGAYLFAVGGLWCLSYIADAILLIGAGFIVLAFGIFLLFGGLWLAVRLISLYVRGVKWVAGELLGKKVAAYE